VLLNLLQKLQRGSALVVVDIGKLQDVYQKLATSLKDKVRCAIRFACCQQVNACAYNVPITCMLQTPVMHLASKLKHLLLTLCKLVPDWLVTVRKPVSKEGCHAA
jgi:hypothetical protein